MDAVPADALRGDGVHHVREHHRPVGGQPDREDDDPGEGQEPSLRSDQQADTGRAEEAGRRRDPERAEAVAQAAGQRMREGDTNGQIINISSIFGSIGVQGRGPYNASKGGVNNLTRCLAVELAEHDIQVNALAPGFIRTELDEQTRESSDEDETLDEDDWPYYGYDDQHIRNRTPMNRFGTLEEMANCALFLAAGDHYMTGEILHADGGWRAFGWNSKGR